jgi:NTE family protein
VAKIGLALSGGGVRGFAHIGVLSNLNWLGIPVNMISGSSMGAVIGAAYAAGINLDILKNLLSETSLFKVINPILPYYGLSNFEKIKKFFMQIGLPKTFEELKIPLIVATTDLKKRTPVFFNNGNLWDALFGSLAMPGIFYPVKMGEMLLIDGGITLNLPVTVLKENGADFVIASDVNTYSRKYPDLAGAFQIVYEAMTLMIETNTKPERAAADFVIDVPLEGIGFLDFKKSGEILNISHKETYERIAGLKKILEEKNYVQDRGLGPLFVSPLP